MEIFFRDMTTAVKLLKTISIFLSPPAYQATYALKGQKFNCLIHFFNYDFFFNKVADKFCQGSECLVTQSHIHNSLWRWQKSICSNSQEIIVPLENHFFYTQKIPSELWCLLGGTQWDSCFNESWSIYIQEPLEEINLSSKMQLC